MSKAYYSVKPSTMEAYAQGKTLVNYNIKEVEREVGEETIKEWECDQVVVANPLTKASIVEALVREKYSVSDELAILRQRDSKAEEFAAYNAFVEDCKSIAKEIIGE